jgi:DNA-binding MarR family transcriptional regulator
VEVASSERAGLLSDVFAQVIRVSLSEGVVEALTSAQVTYAQYEALRYVQSHSHATVGDLASGLRTSYPSATNMVSRLCAKGLLMKRGTRADRRIVRLALTPAGEKLVCQVKEERNKRLSEILGAMRCREQEHFLMALDNFIVAAGRCGFADPNDICLACGTSGHDECSLLHLDVGAQCR